MIDDARAARIGVVVVSWNVRELLRACLASLASTPEPLAVVVVDNASSDGSADMVAADFPAVTLIRNAANLGFTRANNQGFRALGVAGPGTLEPGAPPFTLILNPDTEVHADALTALADYLAGHPDVAAVGPRLLDPDGSTQPSRRRFPSLAAGWFEGTPWAWRWPNNPVARRYHMADVPDDVAGPVDWLTGAAILFRSDALAAAGGFDEGFFMYAEEMDLCRRLRGAGGSVHYCPAARVTHHEGKSSEQAMAARHLRFQRSRVRYFHKHHGAAAANLVRAGIIAQFAFEWLVEAAKWLAGHRRAVRRARMAAYARILADGLSPRTASSPDDAGTPIAGGPPAAAG